MRWGLRDDGCPWCCSRWRSAPSPAAPPPARFPATRAGDFSHARAGIDQKIVALRARSESRLKSNAGNDQTHRRRNVRCNRSARATSRRLVSTVAPRAATAIQNMQWGRAGGAAKLRSHLHRRGAPRRGARAIGDDLALTRAESASANLCAAWRINSGATVFREKRLTLKFA
jgi:hypothetical protein